MDTLDFDGLKELIDGGDLLVERVLDAGEQYSISLLCLASDVERKIQIVDDVVDYLRTLGFAASTSAKDAPAVRDVVTTDAKSAADLLSSIYGERLQQMLDDKFREKNGPITDQTYRDAYELCLEVLADRDIPRIKHLPQIRDALDARDSDELSVGGPIDFGDEDVRGQILEMLYSLGDALEPGNALEGGHLELKALINSFHQDTSRIIANVEKATLGTSANEELTRVFKLLEKNAGHSY